MAPPFVRVQKKMGKIGFYSLIILVIAIMIGFGYITNAQKPSYNESTVKTAIYHKNRDITVITGSKDRKGKQLKLCLPGNHVRNFPIGSKLQYSYKN